MISLHTTRTNLPRRCLPTSWMVRTYASQTPGNPTMEVFNRKTKQLQKERAAQNVEQSRRVDYLKDEMAMRLCDRLLDIKRKFPHILDLGANSCNIARTMTMPDIDSAVPEGTSTPPLAERISKITCVENSRALLHRDEELPFNKEIDIQRDVIPDMETLPYEPNTFDAVVSSLSMHWINDLPALLSQVNTILKPDAPFIAAMFGGDTLFELRGSLQLADQERRGGVSPHISPLADVKDIGGLLNRAGFKMLTVDVEDIVVEFPDTFALMKDLQAMGESNAILHREAGPLSRDVLLANEAIYRAMHMEDGAPGIPATFRMIFMIGWKESETQRQPLARGSADINLQDILGDSNFQRP
ncbi:hypothetical protein N7495_007884 [Penicillium taxi]|uniref:uncharacterized protein n=1 Tax=Penicillium taxi TaxID=168475 RepID=UPI0025459258|nr:uncharacterized protein N7495_007884 [Penicillium taxi]KAJ5887843.1 hypothetical protein N7495_007884 [Penicillium taxi]